MRKLDLNNNQPRSKQPSANQPFPSKAQIKVDEPSQIGQNQDSQAKGPQTETIQSSALKPALKKVNLAKASDMKNSKTMLVVAVFLAILAGGATGYGGYKLKNKYGSGAGPEPVQQVAGDVIKAGDVFGVKDEQTFKDQAEGYLEKGGIEGEGSHSLLRPGGESQTVYLTSSITDLDKFVGMEVKIWGETFKAQRAGWLMDVGRVEVVNPEGVAPVEE